MNIIQPPHVNTEFNNTIPINLGYDSENKVILPPLELDIKLPLGYNFTKEESFQIYLPVENFIYNNTLTDFVISKLRVELLLNGKVILSNLTETLFDRFSFYSKSLVLLNLDSNIMGRNFQSTIISYDIDKLVDLTFENKIIGVDDRVTIKITPFMYQLVFDETSISKVEYPFSEGVNYSFNLPLSNIAGNCIYYNGYSAVLNSQYISENKATRYFFDGFILADKGFTDSYDRYLKIQEQNNPQGISLSQLPIANVDSLGGVKLDSTNTNSGINIDYQGNISANFSQSPLSDSTIDNYDTGVKGLMTVDDKSSVYTKEGVLYNKVFNLDATTETNLDIVAYIKDKVSYATSGIKGDLMSINEIRVKFQRGNFNNLFIINDRIQRIYNPPTYDNLNEVIDGAIVDLNSILLDPVNYTIAYYILIIKNSNYNNSLGGVNYASYISDFTTFLLTSYQRPAGVDSNYNSVQNGGARFFLSYIIDSQFSTSYMPMECICMR